MLTAGALILRLRLVTRDPGEPARFAQWFWGASLAPTVPNNLQGGKGVDPPAGMYGNRADTGLRPQPEADDCAIEHQRARRADAIFWRLTGGGQRTVCDADGRQIEDRAEMQGQPGPPRVVPSAVIHQEQVWGLGQTAYRALEDGAHAKRKEARFVSRASRPGRQVMPAAAAPPHECSRCPCRIAGAPPPGVAARKADEAPSDQQFAGRRLPRSGRVRSERALHLDEFAATNRPNQHRSRVPHHSSPGDGYTQLGRSSRSRRKRLLRC